MVAISFTVFKDKLLSGEKTQTIRRLDVTRLEQMNRLGIQIYWKQRTKESEKLFDAKFVGVTFVAFDRCGMKWKVIAPRPFDDPNTFIDPPLRELTHNEKIGIALKDGFRNKDEMNLWFSKRYGKTLYEPDILGMQPVFMIVEWERV